MAAPWLDLIGGVGFDVLGHHMAQEYYGEQEKLEASSMEGSEGVVTAWWRPWARLGGLKLAAARLRARRRCGLLSFDGKAAWGLD